jgi:hypothetical protein
MEMKAPPVICYNSYPPLLMYANCVMQAGMMPSLRTCFKLHPVASVSSPSPPLNSYAFAHHVLQYNREKEVALFVKDLMSGDEDEAEVPVRAYRSPIVMAAAVQSELLCMIHACAGYNVHGSLIVPR